MTRRVGMKRLVLLTVAARRSGPSLSASDQFGIERGIHLRRWSQIVLRPAR